MGKDVLLCAVSAISKVDLKSGLNQSATIELNLVKKVWLNEIKNIKYVDMRSLFKCGLMIKGDRPVTIETKKKNHKKFMRLMFVKKVDE
jgi:hypothetical protein